MEQPNGDTEMLTSTEPPKPAQPHAVEQTAARARASASNRAPDPSRPLRAAGNDGLACLLRKAVHRRAGSALLQRYEIVVPAAAGANATAAGRYRVLGAGTEFQAQTVDAAHQTIHAPTAPGAAPSLRLSDDAKMAVEDSDLSGRQPKVFYATSGVRSSSNSALKKVGSDYELYVDRANAIEVRNANGTKRKLDRILPRTRAVPAGGRTASQQGMTLDAHPDCIIMAQAVMKHANGTRDARLAVKTPGNTSFNEFRAAAAIDAWANTPNNGSMKKFVKAANQAARTAFATDPVATINTIATSYAVLMAGNPVLAAQVAEALGLNAYAEPNVGEAYETYRVSTTQVPQTRQAGGQLVRDFWGQHIGAVVAKSGVDRVTMENYARSHEIGAMNTAPHYYFQMYGPASKNQSWHEAWAITAGNAPAVPVGDPAAAGSDALTVVIRH